MPRAINKLLIRAVYASEHRHLDMSHCRCGSRESGLSLKSSNGLGVIRCLIDPGKPFQLGWTQPFALYEPSRP